MKTNFSILFLFICLLNLNAQKLDPDVDLISEIISQKQDEIKKRVLKNLIIKNIKTTNYTTYNSMYYLMDIITTEKNKTVMTKDIIKEVSEYAINYALVEYFIRQKLKTNDLKYFAIDKQRISIIEKNIQTDSSRNAVATLIGSKFKFTEKSDTQEVIQSDDLTDSNIKRTIRQNKITNIYSEEDINEINNQRFWETNYIVDRLYEMLSEKSLPILSDSIGIFKKENLERRFKNGLGINYENEIDSTRIKTIDTKLNSFVDEIESLVQSDVSNSVFRLLRDSNNFNFKELNLTSKENIRLLFELFSFSLTEFKGQIGKNSFLAKIGGIIDKYVIYELAKGEHNVFKEFKIDVEAIILSLEDQFVKKTYLRNGKIGFKPFFIIGLNYAVFTDSNTTIPENNDLEGISDVAFVSEKFGVKIMLADFGYSRSHKPNEWYKYRGQYKMRDYPVKEPLIDEIFISIYGSGILYNVVDLKSKDNFDFALVGVGGGIIFFNNLELNLSYAVPYIDRSLSFENSMISLGFDIPIFEYLGALKSKNK